MKGAARSALSAITEAERNRDVRALGRVLASPVVAGSARLRGHVATALYELADPEATEILLDLAVDPDPKVRAVATAGLGRVTTDVRASSSLSAALQDRDRNVRVHAVRGLARIGGHDTEPALIGALDDPERVVRLTAARALAEIRAVDAIPQLERLLARTRFPWRATLERALQELREAGTMSGQQ